jgi:hypothetical protein
MSRPEKPSARAMARASSSQLGSDSSLVIWLYEAILAPFIPKILTILKGRWKKLWSGSPVRIGHQPRQFGPPIEPPSFPFNQIRLYFESLDLPYHAAIDAVCLLGTVQSPVSIFDLI